VAAGCASVDPGRCYAGGARAETGAARRRAVGAVCAGDIGALLDLYDAAVGGPAIGHAQLAIARHDGVALYRRFAARLWFCKFRDGVAVDELDK
jgi:hypothetical protein